ncbi:MAG: glucosamine-6-phosphate deaminase [Verrucomicrobia bacterium]|nr:glucosamine-6-phosphate deaminase [Verrucomicrobiota bacterium]
MNLLRFDSEAAWLAGVAAAWRDRLCRHPRLRMCLPSGKTPEGVYAAMAAAVKAGNASFRTTEIFALDEFGGLRPDDPGRCVNMLRQQLIDRIDLPRDRFHALDVQAPNLEAMCRAYDGDIGRGFDLVLLGVGLNGHLGMNEPGSTRDCPTRRVALHPATVESAARYLNHDRLPTWGVTVGLKQLLNSKEVWLLAAGPAKAEILARAVNGPVSTDVPASLLREHPNCSCFLDAEAAARLSLLAADARRDPPRRRSRRHH